MKKLSVLTAGAAVLAFSPAANAAVVIEQSSSFVQPEENVQLDTDLVAGDNMLRGTTNQTNSTVLFQSSTDNLLAAPQGQARIEPIGSDDGLNQLSFNLVEGGTFTEAEFNIIASVGGTVTISALNAANMLIESLTATVDTSGQNFFGLLADSSTPISSISITSGTAQIDSIAQFRVGGVSPAVGAVPEPATWGMMLIGFGLIGGAMRRRAKVQRRVSFDF